MPLQTIQRGDYRRCNYCPAKAVARVHFHFGTHQRDDVCAKHYKQIDQRLVFEEERFEDEEEA